MIWNSHAPAESRTALSFRVAQDLLRSSGMPALEDCVVDNVVHGVATYCERAVTSGHLHSEHVALLLARSLWACGEHEAARCVADHHCGSDVVRFCWPPVSDAYVTSWRWRLCRAGVVRTSSLHVRRTSNVWIVDMHGFTELPEPQLEMTLFSGLRSLLDGMAHVWDCSSGSGLLGVRGLASQARTLCGVRRYDSARDVAREAVLLCVASMQAQARERRWGDVPEVMNLDLEAA